MLPGFRFLLAAIVLSVSVLIFGLGAAALLRAAHEEFASIPARRILPEPFFAQQSETPAPTLALLRVEPLTQDDASVGSPALALAEEPAPDAIPVPKVETEKLAALKVDEAAPAEAARPELSATPAAESVPAVAEPAATSEVAALEATPAPVLETAPPPAELIVVPATADASGTVTTDKPAEKIAALGNPALSIAAPADTKKTSEKVDRAEIRKKQRAERARERRRLAARRARLAAQLATAAPAATVQQPADPFGVVASQQPTAAKRRR